MDTSEDLYGLKARRIGGHVSVSLPGDGCLWCYKILTEEKVKIENGGKGPTYIKGRDGQAQVISMNGVLASQACSDVLNLISYFGRQPASRRLAFNGLEGSLLQTIATRDPICSHHSELGIGDPVWA